jgi:UDP-galactopyranose mutase
MPDLLCVAHLSWDFVFQRPQHLMTRFAAEGRVFYVEEPVITEGQPHMVKTRRQNGLSVVTPHVPKDRNSPQLLQRLLDRFCQEENIRNFVLWYYTPMALPWTVHLNPLVTVFDCMDELSAFKGAPESLRALEKDLFERADIVFTGGASLYEAKRHLHPNVYLFPSSIDVPHFARARGLNADPPDQAPIPHPRLGYCGVIDERMDLNLLAQAAEQKPEWQFVMLGPTAKIDAAALPKRSNIHYLGIKKYEELPEYIAGWDVAILPFAVNEATRFISPTKIPEYLAAGRPVVSTPIKDVVTPYGTEGLVEIAWEASEFVATAEKAMGQDHASRIHKADEFLAQNSWNHTWGRMAGLIDGLLPKLNEVTSGPSRPNGRTIHNGGGFEQAADSSY